MYIKTHISASAAKKAADTYGGTIVRIFSVIFVDQYRFSENFSWLALDSRNPRKLASHENYQPYGS